jgi:hypothetical protein
VSFYSCRGLGSWNHSRSVLFDYCTVVLVTNSAWYIKYFELRRATSPETDQDLHHDLRPYRHQRSRVFSTITAMYLKWTLPQPDGLRRPSTTVGKKTWHRLSMMLSHLHYPCVRAAASAAFDVHMCTEFGMKLRRGNFMAAKSPQSMVTKPGPVWG